MAIFPHLSRAATSAALAIMVAFWATVTEARAAVVTYRFEGTMSDAHSDPAGTLANGDRVVGSFQFDSEVLGRVLTVPAGDGLTVQQTRYDNLVRSLSVTVSGKSAAATSSSTSNLQIFDDQRQQFEGRGQDYTFDRYILTVFDVPGFGLTEPMYFFQIDIFSAFYDLLPGLFSQSAPGPLVPDLSTLQPYPAAAAGYGSGRFAFTSENRNVSFRLDSFEVDSIEQVPEPGSIHLVMAAAMGMSIARFARRDKRRSKSALL